jgi:hypothetical protein
VNNVLRVHRPREFSGWFSNAIRLTLTPWPLARCGYDVLWTAQKPLENRHEISTTQAGFFFHFLASPIGDLRRIANRLGHWIVRRRFG